MTSGLVTYGMRFHEYASGLSSDEVWHQAWDTWDAGESIVVGGKKLLARRKHDLPYRPTLGGVKQYALCRI